MKWTINLKNNDTQFVIDYCQNWLLNYDTKKLGEIRINNGRRKAGDTFYGHCSYPKRENLLKYYKAKIGMNEQECFTVVCHINPNIRFPFRRQQRRKPIYFKKNGILIEGAQAEYDNMVKSPDWELGRVRCFSMDNQTEWVRVYEYITYNSFDECVAAIFGHEIGHFLSKTKQIKFHNTEIGIDEFEDKFLEDYRNYKCERVTTII